MPSLKARFDALQSCEKLGAGGVSMRKGYDPMLKTMTKLSDQKATADSCKQSLDALNRALESAGC